MEFSDPVQARGVDCFDRVFMEFLFWRLVFDLVLDVCLISERGKE